VNTTYKLLFNISTCLTLLYPFASITCTQLFVLHINLCGLVSYIYNECNHMFFVYMYFGCMCILVTCILVVRVVWLYVYFGYVYISCMCILVVRVFWLRVF